MRAGPFPAPRPSVRAASPCLSGDGRGPARGAPESRLCPPATPPPPGGPRSPIQRPCGGPDGGWRHLRRHWRPGRAWPRRFDPASVRPAPQGSGSGHRGPVLPWSRSSRHGPTACGRCGPRACRRRGPEGCGRRGPEPCRPSVGAGRRARLCALGSSGPPRRRYHPSAAGSAGPIPCRPTPFDPDRTAPVPLRAWPGAPTGACLLRCGWPPACQRSYGEGLPARVVPLRPACCPAVHHVGWPGLHHVGCQGLCHALRGSHRSASAVSQGRRTVGRGAHPVGPRGVRHVSALPTRRAWRVQVVPLRRPAGRSAPRHGAVSPGRSSHGRCPVPCPGAYHPGRVSQPFAQATGTRKSPRWAGALLSNYSGGDLLSQGVTPQVPSARAGLTSVFGMGTGVTPPLWPPETVAVFQRSPR